MTVCVKRRRKTSPLLVNFRVMKIIAYSDEYRVATITFIEDILEHEFHATGIDRPDLRTISRTYQCGAGQFWLALDDKGIAGTVALKDHGEGRGYLQRMYVRPDLRGKGLAQMLLDTLLRHAKDHQYQVLFLATVPAMVAANKFYQKSGFAQIGHLPPDMSAREDSVFYKRELG
jgi:N-acetylglutamate synthase-like GNAT family acetyltransferase